MRFEFATATRILFGAGTLREIGPIAAGFGRKALLVTGRDASRAEPILQHFHQSDISSAVVQVAGEPTIEAINEAVSLWNDAAIDLVVGFGGGSALDTAKAIAAMLTNPGDLSEHLEVVGQGKPLENPPLPFLAVPTTAGTGSEVTRNAVLGSIEHRVKVSLRSPMMLAKVALVDPELTLSLPPDLTATTGLDALTQCIEAYVSCRANPMTDVLCEEGICRAARSLQRVYESGRDLKAREDLSLASLFSGLSLANAGLGAVHGFAGPIGGMFPAPHGAVCAALLPHVMDANVRALWARKKGSPALPRYRKVARLITGESSATHDDGVKWIQRLVCQLGIPRLRSHGITAYDVSELVESATKASSMKGNPIQLNTAELAGILNAAI